MPEPARPDVAVLPADVPAPADEDATASVPQASATPGRAGWRSQILGAETALAVVGLWLIASGVVLDYPADSDAWNPLVTGALVALLAILRLTGAWVVRSLSLLSIALGAWLCASAFLLEAPVAGQWNQGLMGGIVVLLSLVALEGTQRGRELHPDQL